HVLRPPPLRSGLVSAVGGGGRVQVPDLLPFDRLQERARTRYARDGEAIRYPAPAGALGPVSARHDGSAGLAARLGRLREVSRLQLRAGRIGRDLASVCVR